MSAVYSIFTSPNHPPVPDLLPTLIVTPHGRPAHVLYTYLHSNANKENYLLTPSDAGDLCVAKLFPPSQSLRSGASSNSHGSSSSNAVKCEASRNLRWSISNTGIQNPVYKLTLPNPDQPQQDQPLFQVSKPNPHAGWWSLFYFTYAGHLIPPKRVEFGRIQKNAPEAGGGTRVSITGKTEEEQAVWKTLGEGNEDMVEWIVLCAALTVLDDEIILAAEKAGLGLSAGPLGGRGPSPSSSSRGPSPQPPRQPQRQPSMPNLSQPQAQSQPPPPMPAHEPHRALTKPPPSGYHPRPPLINTTQPFPGPSSAPSANGRPYPPGDPRGDPRLQPDPRDPRYQQPDPRFQQPLPSPRDPRQQRAPSPLPSPRGPPGQYPPSPHDPRGPPSHRQQQDPRGQPQQHDPRHPPPHDPRGPPPPRDPRQPQGGMDPRDPRYAMWVAQQQQMVGQQGHQQQQGGRTPISYRPGPPGARR